MPFEGGYYNLDIREFMFVNSVLVIVGQHRPTDYLYQLPLSNDSI